MTKLYVIIAIIFAVGLALKFFEAWNQGEAKEKPKYKYSKKKYFLTRAEHEFYKLLAQAVGNEYVIFAQAHLPTIVDHKVKGQKWYAAFQHINRKSVDFVLCDKEYLSPQLVIELDDRSHEREDCQERDKEIERILEDAGLPLLRIEGNSQLTAPDLTQQIHQVLNPTPPQSNL